MTEVSWLLSSWDQTFSYRRFGSPCLGLFIVLGVPWLIHICSKFFQYVNDLSLSRDRIVLLPHVTVHVVLETMKASSEVYHRAFV